MVNKRLHHLEIKVLIQYGPPELFSANSAGVWKSRFLGGFAGPFKWISVMHGRRHQDSMNTSAHEKRRWGRGGGESISLAMSHWLHCFTRFPGSRGFTSAMPLRRGERQAMKRVSTDHTQIWMREQSTKKGNECLLWLCGRAGWEGLGVVCTVNCNSLGRTEVTVIQECAKDTLKTILLWDNRSLGAYQNTDILTS